MDFSASNVVEDTPELMFLVRFTRVIINNDAGNVASKLNDN